MDTGVIPFNKPKGLFKDDQREQGKKKNQGLYFLVENTSSKSEKKQTVSLSRQSEIKLLPAPPQHRPFTVPRYIRPDRKRQPSQELVEG